MCHMVSLVTMHLNRCAETIRYAILTQHVEQNASLTTVWHVQTIKLCVLVSISTTITITIALETLAVCGRQQTCYDRNASVCLNGTTICPALNARLCGSTCFNPDLQTCSSGRVRCNKSCNGTCYSNSQYCYNNRKVCNNNESVCDIKNYNPFNYVPYGLTCYNASEQVCWNNTLCDPYSACGTKCIADYSMACANNQTLCPGFNFYDYHDYYSTRTLAVCGRQQTCYDRNARCMSQWHDYLSCLECSFMWLDLFQSRSTNMFEWESSLQQVLQWNLLFQQPILLQ